MPSKSSFHSSWLPVITGLKNSPVALLSHWETKRGYCGSRQIPGTSMSPTSFLLPFTTYEKWYCHFCSWSTYFWNQKSVFPNIDCTLEPSGELLKFPVSSTFCTPIKSEFLMLRCGIGVFKRPLEDSKIQLRLRAVALNPQP